MSDPILRRVLLGLSDRNVRFDDLRGLLLRLGSAERTKGSHHIFSRDGIAEILNLQPQGALARAYQVKQVRRVILQYRLAVEGD
jgi:hypothetical protein